MAALTLTKETYRDKVLGAWAAKSAGLTLSAGLRGKTVPGRLTFYHPVPGQPVPSVALDFPFIWLATLEETGPEVAPEDLAVAWLEHLDYSQEEYGYAALNLRRGLPPPASGAHANWFRHNTGGVMRADFWAALAPGAPQVAAAYAYYDASIDHSEEGVWAAMFLAAVGSASFFLTDHFTLATIGLAMIPRTCRTARAVKTALAAGHRAASWLEARESVLKEVGSANFSDVAQNMGFFTLGLIYGMGDFGASLLAGVNCGYDCEAVGGAVGAVLGIQRGRSGLPENWLQPVGDYFVPGVGLRDVETPLRLSEIAERVCVIGEQVVAARCPDIAIETPILLHTPFLPDLSVPAPQPEPPANSAEEPIPLPAAPPTLQLPAPEAESDEEPDTVDSVPRLIPSEILPEPDDPTANAPAAAPFAPALGMVQPQAVSGEQPAPFAPPPLTVPTETPVFVVATPLEAIAWTDSAQVKPLLITPPTALIGVAESLLVLMDPGASPTIAHEELKTLTFSITNRGSQAFNGRVALLAPPGWQITASPTLGQRQFLAPETGTLRAEFTLRVPEGQGRIAIANAVTLRFLPESGTPFEAEFVLMGASCWWTTGPFANYDGEGFDRSAPPEDRPGLNEFYNNRLHQYVGWEKRSFPEPALNIEPLFKTDAGVVYGQTILRCTTTREARLVANTNSGVKVWLHGQNILRRNSREPFRPTIGAGSWAVDVTLRAGDNPVLVKWVRGRDPIEFSLTVSDRYGRGLPEVSNTSWL